MRIKAFSIILTAAALIASTGHAAPRRSAFDPTATLPGAISAVLDVGSAPRLMLVEDDHGVTNIRTLSVGDDYRNGWKIAAITASQVTLRKSGEDRAVPVPTRAAPQQRVATAPAQGASLSTASGAAPGAAPRGLMTSNATVSTTGASRSYATPQPGSTSRGSVSMSSLSPDMQQALSRYSQGGTVDLNALMQQYGGAEGLSAFTGGGQSSFDTRDFGSGRPDGGGGGGGGRGRDGGGPPPSR